MNVTASDLYQEYNINCEVSHSSCFLTNCDLWCINPLSRTIPTYCWQLPGSAVRQRIGGRGGDIVTIDAAVSRAIPSIAIDTRRKVLL